MKDNNFYSRLNEHPDYVEINNKRIDWNDIEYRPVTFGWYNDELYAVASNANNLYRNTHSELVPKDEIMSGGSYVPRPDYTISGRLWIELKVISFWSFPKEEETKTYLIELGEKINIDIVNDPDWKIEIVSNEHGEQFIPVIDYIGSKKLSDEEFNKEHINSPLLKKKKRRIPGFGSDRTAPDSKHPLKLRQKMYTESFYPQLNESPDGIVYNNQEITWNDYVYAPITFGWYNNKLYTKEVPRENPENAIHAKIVPEDEIMNSGGLPNRRDFTISGRLWTELKVISFWLFPEKEEMNKYLIELGKKLNIDFINDDGWKIEIVEDSLSSDFVSIDKYLGASDIHSDYYKDHVISPVLKKKKTVPSGVGSKNSKTKSLKMKQAMYAESFYPRLNENPNAIIPPEVWKEHMDKGLVNKQPFPIEHDQTGNIPFAYGLDGKIVIGSGRDIHQRMMGNNTERLDGRSPNSGRVFTKQKALTFWCFPSNKAELIKVVQDIERAANIDILNDDSWLVEIPTDEKILRGETPPSSIPSSIGGGPRDDGWDEWEPKVGDQRYVKIQDYSTGVKRTEIEMNGPHKSPKGGRERKFKKRPSLKVRQAMYSEGFYPKLK